LNENEDALVNAFICLHWPMFIEFRIHMSKNLFHDSEIIGTKIQSDFYILKHEIVGGNFIHRNFEL